MASTPCVSTSWFVGYLAVFIFIKNVSPKGVWRMVLVDDRMPVDAERRLLLPCSALREELWPLLVAKACAPSILIV